LPAGATDREDSAHHTTDANTDGQRRSTNGAPLGWMPHRGDGDADHVSRETDTIQVDGDTASTAPSGDPRSMAALARTGMFHVKPRLPSRSRPPRPWRRASTTVPTISRTPLSLGRPRRSSVGAPR